MTKLPSLTIVIPAYNEQENIGNMLISLLKQQISHARLQQIIVVSDGSRDNTVMIVRALAKSHKILTFVSHTMRQGKVARLNEIFADTNSDYLIVFDADIAISSTLAVDNMVKSLVESPKLALLAAHQIPIKSKSLVGKAINSAYQVWDDTRLAIMEQDHIQNFYGAASGYAKKFYKNLVIPDSITDERGYIYLKAREYGEFKYDFTSVIYYRPVETLHDLWKLGDRSFGKNQKILAQIFGEQVFSLYHIPLKYKLKSVMINLFKSPTWTILGLVLNVLIRMFPVHDHDYDSGMWEPAISTKKVIKL